MSAQPSKKVWLQFAEMEGLVDCLNTDAQRAIHYAYASRDAEVAVLRNKLSLATQIIGKNNIHITRLQSHIRAIAEHHDELVRHLLNNGQWEDEYHTERRDFALSVFK